MTFTHLINNCNPEIGIDKKPYLSAVGESVLCWNTANYISTLIFTFRLNLPDSISPDFYTPWQTLFPGKWRLVFRALRLVDIKSTWLFRPIKNLDTKRGSAWGLLCLQNSCTKPGSSTCFPYKKAIFWNTCVSDFSHFLR